MARYIDERPRFSKRENSDAEKQYIDNFIDFHKYVKDLAYAHFVADNYSAVVLAAEIKRLLSDFEVQQEKLLEVVTNEMQEENDE